MRAPKQHTAASPWRVVMPLFVCAGMSAASCLVPRRCQATHPPSRQQAPHGNLLLMCLSICCHTLVLLCAAVLVSLVILWGLLAPRLSHRCAAPGPSGRQLHVCSNRYRRDVRAPQATSCIGHPPRRPLAI
jgi:hypothetical protein